MTAKKIQPKAQHTPGPWTVEHEAGRACITGADMIVIEEAVTRRRADISLIAAAPELLEALERVDEMLPLLARADSRAEARALIRAAIAKARGES